MRRAWARANLTPDEAEQACGEWWDRALKRQYPSRAVEDIWLVMGGRGSVTGSFLGVLIMATLNAGLTQVATKDWMKYLVSGVVIVLAVIVDAWRIRNRKSASA